MAAAVNYADRAAFSAVVPPLRAELGLSDAAIGLVGSVFLWCYALASPMAGMLADRWSRPRIAVASLILWSAITVATGWANGLVALCICRGLLGVFESLYHPAAFALVADHHGPATRARAMSLLSIGFQFGVVAGGATAGYLAEAVGWRAGFWVLGGFGVLLASVGPRWLGDTPTLIAPAAAKATTTEAFRYLSGIPSFYILLLKSMLTGITTWIFFAWLPLYFQEAFDMKLGAAGFAGTFMLQASKVAGVAGGGWLSDKFAVKAGDRRMLVLAGCYICAGPFLLTFLGKPGFGVAAGAVALFSFFGGMGLASEQPTLAEVVPPQFRSTAIGLSNLCATAAGGLGVLLAGILKQKVGLSTVFAASCFIYLVTAAFVLWGYFFFIRKDIARAKEVGDSRQN